MNIIDIRVRAEDGKVVVQVCEEDSTNRWAQYSSDKRASWRDAKVEDLMEIGRIWSVSRRQPREEFIEQTEP